jgi:hypothetical protein
MKKDIKKSLKVAFLLAVGILAGFVALIALFMIWAGGLEIVEALGLAGLCASSMAVFLTLMNAQRKPVCKTLISKS